MLRFNIQHFPLDLPVIAEAKKMLVDRGLKCLELTCDEDDPRNCFTDLLAAELNKVPDPKYGTIEHDNHYLDEGTKGVVLYDGTLAVARMVINPRWKSEKPQALVFVSSLTHVLEGRDVLDLTAVLLKCAEAFVSGHVERQDEDEILRFYEEGGGQILFDVTCDKSDENRLNFFRGLGFETVESCNGLGHLQTCEKDLNLTDPDGSFSDDGLSDLVF